MTVYTKNKELISIRWLIRKDMDQIEKIACCSFDNPPSRDDMIRDLKRQNIIALVAEISHTVVGYIFYGLQSKQLKILYIAVMPEYRRRGVAKSLISNLKGKLTPETRNRLYCTIEEDMVEAQLFFRSELFRYVQTFKNYKNDRDAYLFEFWKT